MKNKLVLILSLAIVLTGILAWASFGVVADTSIPILGDANQDGIVNMGDVTSVERQTLGFCNTTLGADANRDGKVDVGDIIKIERFILRLDTIPGDANGDAQVTRADLPVIYQVVLAGGYTVGADANQDLKVDMQDIVYIELMLGSVMP